MPKGGSNSGKRLIQPVLSESKVQPLRHSRKRHQGISPKDTATLIKLYGSKWYTVEKLRQVATETGIPYRKGKFSLSERHIVMAAVETWIKESGMGRETFLDTLFNTTGRARFRDFFVRVAEQLPGRPVLMVYHYMRRQLHPGNHAGTWTPSEDAQLRRLFTLRGPQWTEISKELGRFGTACRDRYRRIREAYNKGSWQEDEVERLVTAIQMTPCKASNAVLGDVLDPSDSANTPLDANHFSSEDGDLSWFHISECVKTRSILQCISKWSSLLQTNPSTAAVPKWTSSDDYRLCHYLYDLGIEDESEVRWREILAEDAIWVRSWSAEKLRNRWRMLRRRVYNESTLEMDTILESLLLSLRASRASEEEDEEVS